MQVLVSINMLGLICRIHEKQAAADPTAPPGGIYSGGKHCLTLLAFKRPADRDKLAVQLYRFYEKLLTYIGRWSQETGAPDHISALEFRCYNNKVGGLVEICEYIINNGAALTHEDTGLKALLARHTVRGRRHRDGGSEAKSCTPDKVSAAGPPKPLPAPRHPSARPVGVARRRPGCRPELPLLFCPPGSGARAGPASRRSWADVTGAPRRSSSTRSASWASPAWTTWTSPSPATSRPSMDR